MQTFLKSPLAARRLGISYHRLMGLIRYEKIPLPDRDSSGDFLWSEEDLERARRALAARGGAKPEAAATAPSRLNAGEGDAP